ncbi:hypothetical protein PG997_002639 [Apiospora hydei]|uniref:Uncharacterized protein n=1 Tax=Apiospora hydei TaxID=1337664 RepID=A0ABR1WX06_9PEZI
MGFIDLFWRMLGYNTRQDEERVKIRTKTVDDNWTHVSVPKKIPEFEERWVEVRQSRKSTR